MNEVTPKLNVALSSSLLFFVGGTRSAQVDLRIRWKLLRGQRHDVPIQSELIKRRFDPNQTEFFRHVCCSSSYLLHYFSSRIQVLLDNDRFYIVEIHWPEDYPNVTPTINLDLFSNRLL